MARPSWQLLRTGHDAALLGLARPRVALPVHLPRRRALAAVVPGRTVVVAAPAYATVVYAIWDFVFDGGGDSWLWGWSGVLVLVAALIAVTAQLMARTTLGVRLAWSAGVLAAGASAISLAAIWQDDPGDTIGKTLAVAWIFTGLTYLLIPVLHRFATAGAASSDERVIASLDDVELVLTRSRDGLEVELDPGERLILRRRESGFRPVGSDPG